MREREPVFAHEEARVQQRERHLRRRRLRDERLELHERSRGSCPLRGRQRKEHVTRDRLRVRAECRERRVGVRLERATDAADLVERVAREELPVAAPSLPQPRQRELHERHRRRRAAELLEERLPHRGVFERVAVHAERLVEHLLPRRVAERRDEERALRRADRTSAEIVAGGEEWVEQIAPRGDDAPHAGERPFAEPRQYIHRPRARLGFRERDELFELIDEDDDTASALRGRVDETRDERVGIESSGAGHDGVEPRAERGHAGRTSAPGVIDDRVPLLRPPPELAVGNRRQEPRAREAALAAAGRADERDEAARSEHLERRRRLAAPSEVDVAIPLFVPPEPSERTARFARERTCASGACRDESASRSHATASADRGRCARSGARS